ncbi:UNVERIFIED_CONTAM: hypothetical protein PYX00_006434 [Menopon gallinae]|uniref:Uncharacterized protein n=1 Tax=Menopon gallinae TaxID=328185 RepID=A0AAW2HW67_9NEOP
MSADRPKRYILDESMALAIKLFSHCLGGMMIFSVVIIAFCAGMSAAQEVSAVVRCGDPTRSPFCDRSPYQVVPFRHQFFQVFAVGTVQNATAAAAQQQPRTVIPQVMPIPLRHGRYVQLPVAQQQPLQQVQHHPYRVRPQLVQEVVNVPSLQRYLQTSHVPVVEKIHYEAIPIEPTDLTAAPMPTMSRSHYPQYLQMP